MLVILRVKTGLAIRLVRRDPKRWLYECWTGQVRSGFVLQEKQNVPVRLVPKALAGV